MLYDDDVPLSVTRPPTLIGDDFGESMEYESEDRSRDDMVCSAFCM